MLMNDRQAIPTPISC